MGLFRFKAIHEVIMKKGGTNPVNLDGTEDGSEPSNGQQTPQPADNTDNTSNNEPHADEPSDPNDEDNTDYSRDPDEPDPNDEDATDYTQDPDDMGDEGNTEEDNGDGDTEDTPTDDSTSGDGAGSQQLKSLEGELFKDLSPEQMRLKNIELKQQYIEVYGTITASLARLEKIERNESNAKIVKFVSDKLNELKDLISYYLKETYDTKSYIENNVMYQKYLTVLNTVTEIFEKIKIKDA